LGELVLIDPAASGMQRDMLNRVEVSGERWLYRPPNGWHPAVDEAEKLVVHKPGARVKKRPQQHERPGAQLFELPTVAECLGCGRLHQIALDC